MSYIGRGLDAISNVEKLDNITFDGSATYALEKSSVAYTPSGANNILISIDGVVQQGNFSISGQNIVMDWSPTSSNTCDWILHIGVGVLNIPADGSISLAKMAANSVDSDSYVDGSIDTAHIDALQVTGAKLNTDVISAQTELAVAPADADEFMVSDGGVLKRVDYSLIKGGGVWEESGSTALSSSASTLSVTGCFTTDYISYMITGYLKPTDNTQDITFKFRTDSGTVEGDASPGSNYYYGGQGYGSNGLKQFGGGDAAEAIFVDSAWEDDYAGGASLTFWTNLVKTKTTIGGATIATGNVWRPALYGSYFTYDPTYYYTSISYSVRHNLDQDKQLITGLYFACTDNIDTGSWIKVYGLKE